MRKIFLTLAIITSLTSAAQADELVNYPKDLNDGLTTGSGYNEPSQIAVQPVSYHGDQAAECRSNESSVRSHGSTEADAATAYYDCLKQTLAQ